MSKRIDIDYSAGFCFGVDQAIKIAEKNLQEGHQVFGLGNMVHNDEENSRLESMGLKSVNHDDLSTLTKGKVIFRAHGEPPNTYKLASELKLDVIDATCPIVLKLQKKIRKKYIELDHDTEQIVIYGKKDHPETIGLMGQTENRAVLITDPDNLEKVDPKKSIFLFSQTTMDPDQFKTLEINLKSKKSSIDSTGFNSTCSICNQMKKRKPNLKKFVKAYDLVFFVSGKNSSNGKMLFEYCKSLNASTYWIHKPEDIILNILDTHNSIGITGATSTSINQLEKVKTYIEKLIGH